MVLFEAFQDLKDPQIERHKRHSLEDILDDSEIIAIDGKTLRR